MSARRVVITGIGYVAPPTLAEALAGRLQASPDPPPEITAFEVAEGVPAWGFEVLELGLEKELPHIKSFVDRTSALALVAAKRALADAGLGSGAEARPSGEIGCAYGTTLGCLEAMTIFWNKVKTSNPKFAQPLPFTHGYANSPSSLLCIEYKLRGPAATFSGEKLAGAEALLFAHDQIASGAGDAILAGASDSLTPAALNHLFATGQLSQSGKWEDGIIPGEGAAMAVLESEESAKRRGARILAVLNEIKLNRVTHTGGLPKGATSKFAFFDSPQQQVAFRYTAAVGELVPFTGDLQSVSPVLGVCVVADKLSGRQSRPALGTEAAHADVAGGDTLRSAFASVLLSKWHP